MPPEAFRIVLSLFMVLGRGSWKFFFPSFILILAFFCYWWECHLGFKHVLEGLEATRFPTLSLIKPLLLWSEGGVMSEDEIIVGAEVMGERLEWLMSQPRKQMWLGLPPNFM